VIAGHLRPSRLAHRPTVWIVDQETSPQAADIQLGLAEKIARNASYITDNHPMKMATVHHPAIRRNIANPPRANSDSVAGSGVSTTAMPYHGRCHVVCPNVFLPYHQDHSIPGL